MVAVMIDETMIEKLRENLKSARADDIEKLVKWFASEVAKLHKEIDQAVATIKAERQRIQELQTWLDRAQRMGESMLAEPDHDTSLH
jgi:chromosome segregation ATPase